MIIHNNMIKLLIYKTERKRVSDIFQFLNKSQSKVYIHSEGIDFTHAQGQGQISKELFVDYAVQGKKRLSITDDAKTMKSWLKSWKEIEAKNGRTSLIEISV